MIQVRVAQQSAVSVRIAGAAPVRVDVTGTTYDTSLLQYLYAACRYQFNSWRCKNRE